MSRNYRHHHRSRQPQLSPQERQQRFLDNIASFLPNYIGGQVSCLSEKGWGREKEEKQWAAEIKDARIEGDELVVQVNWAAKNKGVSKGFLDWRLWSTQEIRISLDFASKKRQMPYGRLCLKAHTEDGFEHHIVFWPIGQTSVEKAHVKGLGRAW